MRRHAKPAKAKIQARPPATPKSRKTEGSRVRDLEKRLAEALTHEAQALEQQAAAAEILRVISSSPATVQPVLDAIVRAASRLCDSPRSNLMRVAGDDLQLVARCVDGSVKDTRDLTDPFHRAFPMRIDESGLAGLVIRERRTFSTVDAQCDERLSPDRRQAAIQAGVHSLVGVPLVREGIVIGALNVARTDVKPYTLGEIQLLQTFADQAVIAIENVRLFTELQEKNHTVTEALQRQTATAELKVIRRSQTELQPVFDAIADSVLRLLGAWSVVVCRFDGELLHLAAVRGGAGKPDASALSHFPTRPTTRLTVGRCILARSVIQISDVESETEPVAATREMARARGWRSALAVPMGMDSRSGRSWQVIPSPEHSVPATLNCFRPSPTRR